jgi:hypothetical protein
MPLIYFPELTISAYKTTVVTQGGLNTQYTTKWLYCVSVSYGSIDSDSYPIGSESWSFRGSTRPIEDTASYWPPQGSLIFGGSSLNGGCLSHRHVVSTLPPASSLYVGSYTVPITHNILGFLRYDWNILEPADFAAFVAFAFGQPQLPHNSYQNISGSDIGHYSGVYDFDLVIYPVNQALPFSATEQSVAPCPVAIGFLPPSLPEYMSNTALALSRLVVKLLGRPLISVPSPYTRALSLLLSGTLPAQDSSLLHMTANFGVLVQAWVSILCDSRISFSSLNIHIVPEPTPVTTPVTGYGLSGIPTTYSTFDTYGNLSSIISGSTATPTTNFVGSYSPTTITTTQQLPIDIESLRTLVRQHYNHCTQSPCAYDTESVEAIALAFRDVFFSALDSLPHAGSREEADLDLRAAFIRAILLT